MAYTGASARKKQLEAAAKARLIGAHGSGSQQSREHSRSVGGSLTDDVAASLNTVELSVRGFLPVGPRLSVTLRPNSKEIPVMTLDNHQLPSHRSILAAAKGSTPLAVDAEARLVSTWYRLGLRARNATGQDLVELVESIFGIEF
ncbi:hypothetical protein M8818_005338 [Zalaria obscura]|uniref:Uncharacterized protein n=1 Tax=Zalaria obscura TaxID=2024903 RepID=A0ACC3S9X2_9PEZI